MSKRRWASRPGAAMIKTKEEDTCVFQAARSAAAEIYKAKPHGKCDIFEFQIKASDS